MRWISTLSIYTLSGFLTAGIPFLLLPILTHYLSPSDYGIVSLFGATERLLLAVITFGLIDTAGTEFFRRDSKKFRIYLSTGIGFSFLMAIGFTIVAIVIPAPLYSWIKVPKVWGMAIPAICFFFMVKNLLAVILRNLDRPLHFGVFSITTTLLEVTLTIVFVIGLGMTWEGRLSSHLITAIVVCAASLFLLNKWQSIGCYFSKKDFGTATKLGFFLLPDSISVFVLEMSDRYFISNMTNLETTGLYSVGSQISMVVLILSTAIANAIFPKIYSTLKTGNRADKIKIVRLTYLSLAILFVAVVLISFVGAPIIFTYVLNSTYSGGAQYVFWVSLGYFFLSIHVLFKVYCLYNHKMRALTYTSICAMSCNVLLNYFLIKEYGAIGAAYATSLSYGLAGLMMVGFAVRVEKMPWLAALKKSK